MQLIFDHMIATLIGVTVIMALLSTQLRVQQAGVEQVSAHSAKTKALSLGQWLEDDITSLGANFGRNLMRFELPVYDEHGNTTEWSFYSDSIGDGGAITRHATRYRLARVDSILQDDQWRALYQMYRETASTSVINGVPGNISDATWAEDGRTVATLSRFHIGLVERGGQTTTDIPLADFIRVQFSMVPEFDRQNGYLHELYWNTLLKVRPFWQPPMDQS
jgi:hypothetical protein